MSLPEESRRRLRRLVIVAACGLAALGLVGIALMLTGARAGLWPLIAADLALTLAVLAIGWRGLR